MDACDRLDDPIATVVVATRDRPQDLSDCLDRLDGLPEQPPVIVVDNGSAVSPAPVCAGRPEVTLVPLPGNLGAAARNVGARLASTEVVAFCDDDSWWEPGALATATRFLNEHRQAALAVAKVLVEPSGDLDPVSACIGAGPFDIEWRRRPGGHRAVAGFLACSAVVRRDAFLAAGGFPEELVIGGEETPLALRLAAAGWHLGYVPEAVVHHRPAVGRDPHRRRALMVRNDLWWAWSELPPAPAVRHTAAALAAAGTRAGRQGLAEALRGLPAAIGRRNPVPGEVARRFSELGAV